MNALQQLRVHAARYDSLAWAAALAACAAMFALTGRAERIALGAAAILVLCASAWLAKKWVGPARGRWTGATSLIALWVWTLWVLWYLGTEAYPYPRINRAHAELYGVELGPYLVAILASTVAITGCALPAIRVLGRLDAADNTAARLACFVAPLASIPLAFAPVTWLPAWKIEAEVRWIELFGFDHVPFLLYLKTGRWWGVLAAVAFALCMLAWIRRRNVRVFAGALAAELALLAVCGGLVAYAVLAGWLPEMPNCKHV